MTLYELANATTIQGNVEVRLFSCGASGDPNATFDLEELAKFQYPDCDDFAHSGYRDEDYDIDGCDVVFIYSIVGDNHKIWTVIEVEADN